MDQPAFLKAGDDLDVPSGGAADPLGEGLRIARVAHGAGGDDPDLVGDVQLHGLVEAFEGLDGGRHGVGGDHAGLKDALAQASDLAILMQGAQLVIEG